MYTYNRAPTITHIIITSDDSLNRSRGNLTGEYTFSDLDGNTEQNRDIKWYRNGSEEVTAANQTYLLSTNTSKNELWIFSVRVNDGIVWSTWYNSTEFEINNTGPVANTASLAPLTAYTDTTFTCSGTFSDEDGDSVTAYYLFEDDDTGTLRDWSTSSTYSCTNANCDKWNNVTCQYKVDDGNLNSSAVSSNTVTVLNSNPDVYTPVTHDSIMEERKRFVWREDVIINVSVSDPDGAADLSSVVITITDPTGVVKVDNASMAQGLAITNGYNYSYTYNIPAASIGGTWNVTVYAIDSEAATDWNETYFIVGADHTIIVKVILNNSFNTVYNSGVGGTNASLLGPGTVYSGLDHWYIASFKNNLVTALAARGANRLNSSNRTNTHTIQMEQDLIGSMIYLAVTEGDRNTIGTRIPIIETGTFRTEIAPSFSYGLGLRYPIKMVLNFTDIDVQGNINIVSGLHRIEIESNTTGGQRAVYIRDILE
jgi:hypothetical protein